MDSSIDRPAYGWSDYLSHTLAWIIMRIKVRFCFGHVRTYSWLHKLRNTQRKIYGFWVWSLVSGFRFLVYSFCFLASGVWSVVSGFGLLAYCFCLFYIINICGYSSYIPYIFHIYIYIFPRYVPCIFPCVFLNLWSQEKISPYRKTMFLLLIFPILYLLYFYQ